MNKEERSRNFWYGLIVFCVIIILGCIAWCVHEMLVFDVESRIEPQDVPQAVIVYTDYTDTDKSETLSDALTLDMRDYYAELVAGKAVGEPAGCQQAVATVLWNAIQACDGDVGRAVSKYHFNDMNIPAEDTYDAVDAVFIRSEFLLDDDVLYFGVAGQPFDGEEVCTIGHITFYKESRTW